MNKPTDKARAGLEERFHVARMHLRKRNWKFGQDGLVESSKFAESQGLIPEQEMIGRIQDELALYFQSRILPDTAPEPFDSETVLKRDPVLLEQSRLTFSNALFFVNHKGIRFFGRKTVSESWLDYSIGELHCSLVKPSMLMGVVATEEPAPDSVTVRFHPLTASEKLGLFEALRSNRDAEIQFPYPRLKPETRDEWEASQDGWEFDPIRAEALGAGESHLRDYTLFFLQQFDMQGKSVYDPACSTGEFLSAIKKRFPGTRTIGQDLSQSMIDRAREKLDEAYVGNALTSPLKDESVDFTFIRFLNHEIISRKNAPRLFEAIARRTKPEGRVILFGHTPLALNGDFFREAGFHVAQAVASLQDGRALFQYYVLVHNA